MRTSIRPAVWSGIGNWLAICAAAVFQLKMYAPDISYGVIALLLAGAFIAKTEALHD